METARACGAADPGRERQALRQRLDACMARAGRNDGLRCGWIGRGGSGSLSLGMLTPCLDAHTTAAPIGNPLSLTPFPLPTPLGRVKSDVMALVI